MQPTSQIRDSMLKMLNRYATLKVCGQMSRNLKLSRTTLILIKKIPVGSSSNEWIQMLRRKRSVFNNPQQIKRKVWSLVKWIECGIYSKMKKTKKGCRAIKNRPKVKMRRSLKLTVQSGSRGGTRSAVKVSPIESAMITKSMICFSSQEKFSKRDLLQVSRLESVNRGKVMKDRLDLAEVKGSQIKIKRFLKSDLLTPGLKMCWHL